MQFKDVVGQEGVKNKLIEMISKNRLSHALLFLGKEGVGALPLALAFAQYVVCENKTDKDACGECAACKKANQWVHPDVHYAYPVIKKKDGEKPKSADFIKEWRSFLANSPYGNAFDWLQFIGAENKQGNITAEECNDIIKKLSLKSYESEYKILVLWMPEYLSKEGNKLLKLIEEPPAKTLFILVAESEEKILPTILSRTQLVKIPMLELGSIQSALAVKAGLSEDAALTAAHLAEGSYRSALLSLDALQDDWQKYLREWLNIIFKDNAVALAAWIEEISRIGREKQKQFLGYFSHLLAQSIRLRVLGAENVQLSANDRDFAARLNQKINVGQQEAILAELDKATYYIERNANAKLLFHALSIKLKYIIRQNTVILAN